MFLNALETLYVIDRVKAWPNTDYEGVRKKDKLLMSDTGLMASILRWRFDQVQFDGDRNGKLLEGFVYQQIITVIDAQEDQHSIYHYRDAAKREIDFLIENMNGDILAIEVKAGSAVKKTHFKHLEWFKNNLAKGRKFKGVILYSGEHVLSFGEGMWAAPISTLWS
jgi:uncharacterized protein